MIARTPPPWLSRTDTAALAIIGLAVFFGVEPGADAAPDALFFSPAGMIPVLPFAMTLLVFLAVILLK